MTSQWQLYWSRSDDLNHASILLSMSGEIYVQLYDPLEPQVSVPQYAVCLKSVIVHFLLMITGSTDYVTSVVKKFFFFNYHILIPQLQ